MRGNTQLAKEIVENAGMIPVEGLQGGQNEKQKIRIDDSRSNVYPAMFRCSCRDMGAGW